MDLKKKFFFADTNSLNNQEFKEMKEWMGGRKTALLADYCLVLLDAGKIETLIKLFPNFDPDLQREMV